MMLIRPERPEEFAAIHELVETAFATAKVSNGDEQNFVDRLRAGADYIPELALVAEDESDLIGHVMLTRTFVSTATGRRPLLLLAPLSVARERRRRGVGAGLVGEALQKARVLGHGAVTLVGDPAYYGRFGFRPTTEFGIVNENGIPSEFVMALELTPGALANATGAIRFAT